MIVGRYWYCLSRKYVSFRTLKKDGNPTTLFLRRPENHFFASLNFRPLFTPWRQKWYFHIIRHLSLYSSSLTYYLYHHVVLYEGSKRSCLVVWDSNSTPRLPFIDLLTPKGRRRRDRRFPRVSLFWTIYSDLAFKRLLDSGNYHSLLNACGHDHSSFQSLHEIFQPVYDLYYIDVSSGFIWLAPLTITRKR